MNSDHGRYFKPIFAVGVVGLAVGLLAGLNVVMSAIPAPAIVGIVEDWSTHHVVYTNPGTASEALAQGRFERWFKTVNDPRYIMQQMKRDPLQRAVMAAPDFAARMALLRAPSPDARVLPNPIRIPKGTLNKDWNIDIGPIGVGPGNYPAKYSFNGTPNCSDLAVFNTSEAGPGTSATAMGINNLYNGTPTGELNCGSAPTITWAYNTTSGDKVATSVVFSVTGNQIAFVSTDTSSHAWLNILYFQSGEGYTYANPVAPDIVYSSNTDSTAGSDFSHCKTNTPTKSCLVRLELTGPVNDTNSSPFYDYSGSDTLWVGDNSGKVHKFTGVFGGTPAESGTPWATAGAVVLTSPVYDGTYVYVASANGIVYSFVASSAASEGSSTTVTTSGGLGISDSPLLDVSASKLYVTVGYDKANKDSGVFQLSIPTLSTWSEIYFGAGTTTVPQYIGTIDNTHYTTGGTTGYITTCNTFTGNGVYFNPLAISSFPASGTGSSYSTTNNTHYVQVSASNTAVCSPQTENLSGSVDWIFMSIAENPAITESGGCTTGHGCLYNFNFGNGTTVAFPTTATDEFSVAPNTSLTASGTSGIIVDNSASNGSNIYFTANATTNANPPCSQNASDGCAIQVTQAAP
jgi:hypothetical protein